MTVLELILLLRQQPLDAQVVFASDHPATAGSFVKVSSVESDRVERQPIVEVKGTEWLEGS